MQFPAFRRSLIQTLNGGTSYLVRRQSRDGFWRDYQLPPGVSEAWSTAWVGWSLTHWAKEVSADYSLRKAIRALYQCGQQDGWGYNRGVTPDADSTAWSLSFLETMGVHYGNIACDILSAYIDASGRAHTFIEKTNGSWADAHADVTPIVGLALLATGASLALVQRVRGAVLRTFSVNGVWPSFWWPTDAYATAWSLRFLRKSGGLPEHVANQVESWLQKEDVKANAFECALQLLIRMELGLHHSEAAIGLIDQMLDLSSPDGSWAPSAFLQLPPKSESPDSPNNLHADSEGLMSTAIVCAALAEWLRSESTPRRLGLASNSRSWAVAYA